jgi:hypothetical protein
MSTGIDRNFDLRSGMTSNGIVQKLWNYCNIVRDDGLSYLEYIEQLSISEIEFRSS